MGNRFYYLQRSELFNRAVTYINSWPTAHRCKIEKNFRHGVLAIHASEASKRLGTECIRAWHPVTRIIMIGNAMIDYCGKEVKHAAVNNADDDFKQLTEYVSPQDLTAGVSDILDQIARGKI